MKNNLPFRALFGKSFFASIFLLFVVQVNAQLSEESFEGGIPATWSDFGNAQAVSSWEAVNNQGYQNSNAVTIDPSQDNIGDQNTAEYYLVPPQFSVPEDGVIRFYTKKGSSTDNSTEYQLKLSTANQPDINGFSVTLQTYTAAELSTSYEQKTVQIPSGISAGIDIYIAFVAVNTQNGSTPTGTPWFLDNVEVLQGCSPVLADDVNIDNTTTDGATITWNHPTATDFEVAVVPAGDAVPTSGTDVTGTSHTFTGLDSDSDYEAYIKTECANNTESGFAGPFAFTTNILGVSCDSPIEIPDVFNSGEYNLQDNLANYSNPDLTYTTQGSGCLDQSTNYLNGDKAFFTYTASTDGLITLTQTVAGYDPDNPLGNCYNSNTAILIYGNCADVGTSCLAATVTNTNTLESQIQNFEVTAGETYIIVMSSDLAPDAGICFDFTVDGSTCAPPSGFSYDDLLQNSVKISWENPGGFADSWEYVVLPTGTGPPTSAGTSTSTNIGNDITGLDAGTTYDFYARSVCGGSPGDWGDPYTFTTQCSVFSTPYEEDFESTSNNELPDCWYVIDDNSDGITWSTLQGSATLSFFDNPVNDDYLVSPAIDLSGGQKRLRILYGGSGGEVHFEISASTQGVGAGNFTTVIQPDATYDQTGWQEFNEIIIPIDESLSGAVNFAVHITPDNNETATRININNFVVEDMPACSNPVSPQVDEVTQTTATVSWDQGYQETQWEIIVQDDGGDAPEDTDAGTLVDENPYTVENLDPGHQYEYYIRSYCDDQDQSEWVGPIPFITDCASYDTPFYESFNDDDPDTQKFCWETVDANADEFTFGINPTSGEFLTPFFGSIPDFDDYLISPAVNVVGEKTLSFKYRVDGVFGSPGNFGIQVLMSTTDTDLSSFSEIEPMFTASNANYMDKYISINANGPVYIAFRIPPDFSGAAGSLSIDDVKIDDGPGCVEPSDLTIGDVFAEEGNISWTAGYNEEQWEVVVQPDGIGLPPENTDITDDPNYTATDLEPGTAYEVYVRSSCEGGDTSDWIGPVTFITPCLAVDTPFHETFNSDSDSEDCWTINDANQDNSNWNKDITLFPYEGDQGAGIFTGQNGANNDWLISPAINIQDNQRLRFYYRAGSQYYTEDLEVRLSTSGNSPADFTETLYTSLDEPDPIINNAVYKEKIINLPDNVSGTIYLAFHVPQVPPNPSGIRGQSLYVDNVYVEDIPDCTAPSNFETVNITDTSVEFQWDSNSNGNSWQIIALPEGSDAPGDNINENADNVYIANTNPFTVNGLDPSNSYDFYIRTKCGEDSHSQWTGPTNVVTQCDLNNLCEFTFVLYSDMATGAGELQITQNNQNVQTLPFNGDMDGEEFTVFLCTGIQYSVYFETVGTNDPQYANFSFEILDDQDDTVFESPDDGMEVKTTVYTGVSHCGQESCPMPTDLTANDNMELSWTPGDSENEWEVAVQPAGNETLPESGHSVNTPSYTPVNADFTDPYAATYEYFVRAVCSDSDQSYWAGPYVFVRNDSEANAIELPINENPDCQTPETAVSFINSHASSYSTNDEKDVWFDFEATSKVHKIEINGYEGSFYINGGTEPYPEIEMTLYKILGDGSLEEMHTTNSNGIITSYSSELTVGETYKVRLSLADLDTNNRFFHVCMTTPEDLCDLDAINPNFETPPLHYVNATASIITQWVIPGWRTDFIGSAEDQVFLWNDIISTGWGPYSGGQCVQLISDQPENPSLGTPPGYIYDEDDPHGLYQDFDTSEITDVDYSFAYQARNPVDVTVQLFAGPPEGPFTLVAEKTAPVAEWAVTDGTYEVPDGQDETRFMFTQKDYGLGMLVDDTHFKANTDILTDSQDIACDQESIDVEANGVGTWIAADDNPSETEIADADSNATTISGFLQPGTYTYTWQTRYCEEQVSFDYNGVGDIPTVDSLVEYCLGEMADPLTAPSNPDHTLMWFTDATGGIGSTTAPTPDTTTPGTTSYYVAYVNSDGCEGPRAEIEVTVNDLADSVLTFTYDNTCTNAEDNPLPVLPTDFTTGGEFSSIDLTVDATTGEVDLNGTSAGTYDVTYTFETDNSTCTAGGTYTAQIQLDQGQTAVTDFSYPDDICVLSESVSPDLAADFTSGGEFTSDNLTVNVNTGEIDLTNATAGTYTITYTVESDNSTCLIGGSTSVDITLTDSETPVTDFTYPENICLLNTTISPGLADGFTQGGEFSAADLDIDPTTGEIDLTTASAGTYTVTYSIDANVDNCVSSGSSSVDVTINDVSEPVTDFSYDEPICLGSGSVFPQLGEGFTTGGTFSSPDLSIDPATGEIDLSSASEGSYAVTYTVEADNTNCISEGSSTVAVALTANITPVTGFSYSQDMYCLENDNALPILDEGFTQGGAFSSTSGLVLDTETGEINFAQSEPGEYTVTYEVEGDPSICQENALTSYTLTIFNSIDLSVDQDCVDKDLVLTATPTNTSINPDNITYIWKDENGETLTEDVNTLNVSNYLNQHPNKTVPLGFTVEAGFGACSSVATYTVDRDACGFIPKGISPNQDGKNDSFDLSDMNVRSISIYNRYGTKVYDRNGGYSNQWRGQSNNGDDLPDGTYYYSLRKTDGSSLTGWVYVNRQH